MSQAEAALGSPQSNSSAEHKSGARDAESATEKSESGSLNTPSVEERVAEFVAEYPELAEVPLSREDGQRLREELTYEQNETEWWYDREQDRAVSEERLDERRAVGWVRAVRRLLEWYEEYRDRKIRFKKGEEWEVEHDEFELAAENSFQPDYAKREYAQLQALSRETGGGEYEDGREVDGEFEEPWILFLSLTASSKPDGNFVSPVDHDREIVDTWSGNDGVYRAAWDVFDRLGVDAEDWVYHRQGEPHAGGGAATCYRHDHPLIIFDAASIDGEPQKEEFHSLIETHVENCEWAEWSAHPLDAEDPEEQALTLEPVGDEGVGDVAAYMAKYVSFDEKDLLERDIEYIAWASAQWATNSQKYTRSTGANHAITADECKQRARDPSDDQECAHGEEVVYSTKQGKTAECAKCGSPWGIDQEASMVERRVDESDDDDGIKSRWPSARSAAAVDSDGNVSGFRGPPEWRIDAIIDGDGEEHPPSRGGPSMLPLKLVNRTLDEWANSGMDPPEAQQDEKRESSQQQRRKWILQEARSGVMREELVGEYHGDQKQIEHDIEQLLRRGELLDAGNGMIRAT